MPLKMKIQLTIETEGGEAFKGRVFRGFSVAEASRSRQDHAFAAYWDIATYFSEPEGGDVLPERSVSMDGGGHYPHATLEQTASGGLGVMEPGHGTGAIVCVEHRQ